jgi:hypothetical protein
MSIWGPKPDDNDDAADWLAEFSTSPSIASLNDAFDHVLALDSDEYLEVSDGAVAYVAAWIVLQLFDPQPAFDLIEPDQISHLHGERMRLAPGAAAGLAARALRAVRAVGSADLSELFDLAHQDPKIGGTWFADLQSLLAKLAAVERRLDSAK